jgi:predicted nucleic acid-binding protein
MSYFYLDASAVVKRYAHEVGSEWVKALTNPVHGNTILSSRLTLAEVAAALAAKQRAPAGLSRQARDRAVNLFLGHCRTEYRLVEVDALTSDLAVRLTQDYRLRGYDAMHLATALLVNRLLRGEGMLPLTFVSADDDLLAAARAEGLSAENPNSHP